MYVLKDQDYPRMRHPIIVDFSHGRGAHAYNHMKRQCQHNT